MKSIIPLFLFLILSHISYSQNLQIVSDIGWQVSFEKSGPFIIVASDARACVNEIYIDQTCGEAYDSPSLENHFASCEGMKPIWGTLAPEDCKYLDITFWFRKKFTLSESIIYNMTDAAAKIQADNSSTFYMNGVEMGSSSPSQWDTAMDYDVTNHLVEGENEVLIEVANLEGGSCFNYAFLAFCLDISYQLPSSDEAIRNADSQVDIFPNPASDYINIIPKTANNIQNLTIYAVTGSNFFVEKTIMEGELRIPTHDWHNGIYIVEFEIDNVIFHKKVVISKI